MCICKRIEKGDCEEIFNGDLPLKDSSYSGSIGIDQETGDGELFVNAWIGTVDLFNKKLKISYCPFCGSKFKRD